MPVPYLDHRRFLNALASPNDANRTPLSGGWVTRPVTRATCLTWQCDLRASERERSPSISVLALASRSQFTCSDLATSGFCFVFFLSACRNLTFFFYPFSINSLFKFFPSCLEKSILLCVRSIALVKTVLSCKRRQPLRHRLQQGVADRDRCTLFASSSPTGSCCWRSLYTGQRTACLPPFSVKEEREESRVWVRFL